MSNAGNQSQDRLAELRAKFKPPKTLGACIDQLYQLRGERLALQRAVDAIGDQETLMREHIINTFNKVDIEGAKGKLASSSIVRKRVPRVNDWEKLYRFIHQTKAYDLLQRRVHELAWRERMEDGKAVPGVEAFDVITLSLTKL